MNFERTALRYAHTTGFTSVIYTKDEGEYILSVGNDGDLRKWDSIEDDDPTSNCLGEYVLGIAMQNKGRLLASTDHNTVQAYTFPAIDNDGVLMRFTAPVTCLAVNNLYVAAGSDDTNIKIQRQENDTDGKELVFKHAGPVLALDISPVAPYLASVGGDGQLKIWNLDKNCEVKSYMGLPKVNSFESASSYGTPTFEPCNGKWLAYCKDKEVNVLSTTDWELQFTLVDESVTGSYTFCRFSTDGQYLAAGTTSGEISIFNILRKQAMKCEPPPSDCQSITSLAWKPNSTKELAYCDASGQLGTLYATKAVQNSTPGIATAMTGDENIDFEDIEFENEKDAEVDFNGMNNYDCDKDDDGISIEKLKNSIMAAASASVPNLTDDENTRDSSSTRRSAEPVAVIKTFKQQSAFQPSSTPYKLEHRYMAWNSIGIVTAHADGEGDGSIDVEFHDASTHHALHIPNIEGHDMVSLSSSALALAANNSSKLVCIALAAAGGNKEWSVQFPDCESAVAVAATTKVVAVATSSSLLRIFTVLGTQREIISLPGPVVCLAGFEDRLIACYHSAPASETQQYIHAMLIQFRGLTLRTQQLALPLIPGRQITWFGFSDCGSPAFADSMGLLQLYSLKGNFWAPICDTMRQSQSVSNNYFIIDVSERQQIVQAVLCRGCTYPMTNPRPMLQELPLQMPLCDLETDKAELEDSLIRSSFMTVDKQNQTIKETAIKLFALACRSDNEGRARELIETIADPELLLLAVKYASKLGRSYLSEKLHELLPKMQQQFSQTGAPEFDISEPAPLSPHKQSNAITTPHSVSNVRLAPKTMELSALKRSTLKRLSATPTFPKTSIDDNRRAASPVYHDVSRDVDSQENICSEKLPSTESQDLPVKTLTRNPFNSVNPFAAKRKLEPDNDATHGKGILMGANKLKIAKK